MENTLTKAEYAPCKAYILKELAQMYGVSTKTMRSWIKPYEKEISPRRGNYYVPRQVRIIFDKLDWPVAG